MKLEEAVDIIKKGHSLLTVRSCVDYGAFFVFTLAPLYIKKSDDYVTGRIFPAVDKKTGKIFQYDITSDLEAFEKAVQVI